MYMSEKVSRLVLGITAPDVIVFWEIFLNYHDLWK